MSKKILIVDDEAIARERIRRFMGELGVDVEILEAPDGLTAIERIKEQHPDIVFLDIQMPGLTGFEILEQLEHRDFQLVFQTAYDEFAIQAFEASACDYLLKPFSLERFRQALNKAFEQLDQIKALQELESNLRKSGKCLEKITIRQAGKIKILDVDSIECFVSRDHYTLVYSESSEFITDMSLNWLEGRLNPRRFVRCHRNNIVAVHQICELGSANSSDVTLKNGMRLPLSRANRETVIDLFRRLTAPD